MKVSPRVPGHRPISLRDGQSAFTLPEVAVTMAVSMLVMAGLLTTYLFGLRLFEFSKPKLTASDNARNAVGKLISEIRGANSIKVGTGTATTFTPAAAGSLLEGNAVRIYGSTNTNSYAVYYLDSDQALKRRSTTSSNIDVIATSVSNPLNPVFTTENYAGTVLTNDTYNSVLGITMQFDQIEYPIIRIGTNQFYDSYQLRTRVSQRVWDSPDGS